MTISCLHQRVFSACSSGEQEYSSPTLFSGAAVVEESPVLFLSHSLQWILLKCKLWKKMWIEVVLLTLFFSPSHSQGESLVRVDPAESDPLCLGDTVKYTCTLQDTILIWVYSGDGSSHPYDPTSITGEPVELGPLFYSVLDSIDQDNSIFVSTVVSKDGLTAAVNGTSISCFGVTNLDSAMISFSEPEITDASFCMSTISWSPPPCDANCTVSVDGQDNSTVPCSDGSLSVEADLSTKTINITARDQLGQGVVVPAVPDVAPCLTSSVTETSMALSDASTNTAVIVGIVIALIITVVVVVVVLVALYCYRRKGRKHEPVGVSFTENSERVYVNDGSNHQEETGQSPKETVQTPEDEQRLISETAVGGPPLGKDAHGKENRNTSSSTSKVEHGDSDLSATKPVTSSKRLILDGEIKEYKHCASPIIHCKISPLGAYIATADLDGCVRVLECDSWKIVMEHKSTSCVLLLEWVEYDGEDALVAANLATMRIFDFECDEEKGKCLVDFKLRGFDSCSRVLCLAHCVSRSRFALSCQLPKKGSDSVDHTGEVVIDDHGKEKDKLMCSIKVTSPVSCMVFNYHGTQLVTGNMEGKITIFDVRVESNVYTATVHCDWPTPHGVLYNLQYSFDQKHVYSIGKSEELLLQSKLPISHPPEATLSISNPPEVTQSISNRSEAALSSYNPPETISLKIKPGATCTSAVQNADETLPVYGQFFCLMPRKMYILTSSYSQGIVYKVKSRQKVVEKLALPSFDANITCVDWKSSQGVKFIGVLGCADSSVHVMSIIKKNV